MSLNPIDQILIHEGGFVNDPDDKGGATNYGITISTLSDYLGRAATVEDVKNMSESTAREIYEKKYLQETSIYKLPRGHIRILALDLAVNHGPRRGIRLLQKTCNLTGLNPKISTDGILGPISIEAILNCNKYMGYYFSNMICDARDTFYRRIVKNNPSQSKFLKGWLNRSNSFRVYLPKIK